MWDLDLLQTCATYKSFVEGRRGCNCSFCKINYSLEFIPILFSCCSKPESYRSTNSRLSNSSVKVYQQLLRQSELPDLMQEKHFCCVFLMIGLMLSIHFMSWEIIEPKTLKDATADTMLSNIARGSRKGELLLKFIIIYSFKHFSSRLFGLQHRANCSTSHLYGGSSPFQMKPVTRYHLQTSNFFPRAVDAMVKIAWQDKG